MTSTNRTGGMNVQRAVALTPVLIVALLAGGSASAQEAEVSAPSPAPPAATDGKSAPDFPVSLERIREGLEHPPAGILLRAFSRGPDFRVEVRAWRHFDQLLPALDFKAGPIPAGGIYAYEQNRLVLPAIDNPLAQPYAAFNQSQLLTILVQNLVGGYLAERTVSSITRSMRAKAKAVARREVEEAISDYCAAKPDHGAGIRLCVPVNAAAPN